MKTFEIVFLQTIEYKRAKQVEAKNKDEALEIFNKRLNNGVLFYDDIESNDLDFKILEVEEIK